MVYMFATENHLKELKKHYLDARDEEDEEQEEAGMVFVKVDTTPKLTDSVFGWSIKDVMNTNLYKNKVNRIPETFTSVEHYLSSFTTPLIEETHADLRSNMMGVHAAPAREISKVTMGSDFSVPHSLSYLITLKELAKSVNRYEPQVGDLIALTEVKPKCIDDLNGRKRSYIVALVQGMKDDDGINSVLIQSSGPIFFEDEDEDEAELFAVYLTNLTTNTRIWTALHPCEGGFSPIIETVFRINPSIEDNCGLCCNKNESSNLAKMREVISSFGLDGSQKDAVMNCVALTECDHRNSVKLIWGPPGTGKTKTIATLAYSLLKMKRRTLICGPTNVSVMGVAKRLRSCLAGRLLHETYGIGDVVLFGNGKRMKIDEHGDLYDVFLEHRVKILHECLAPLSGWKGSLDKMIRLLLYPKAVYKSYLMKQKAIQKAKEGYVDSESDCNDVPLTFKEFFSKEVVEIGERLNFCTIGLYTNMPTSCLPLEVVTKMIRALDFLKTLHKHVINGKGLTEDLVGQNESGSTNKNTGLNDIRLQCLQELELLRESFSDLPEFSEDYEIRNFVLKNAFLVFCTVSSSAKLHTEGMSPFEFVVIDEAGQVKECESSIPLQLPGLKHAILVGDEKQLPAMVISKICDQAYFGRSLFERLVRLGYKKQLLSVQYRMHPSISLFPNKMFYGDLIKNGSNVTASGFEKRFLKEQIFGPYSFINVTNGQEEFDNRHSRKNSMEVSIIAEIVSKLYRECTKSKQKVRIGCISPYKAQAFAIEQAIGKKYSSDANDAFSVNVRSVDGFQGGEEDIIIMSTVRTNGNGSVGFLDNYQRTNVALTRARYCLWILGNGATLLNSGSVWQKLVKDAKERGCYYNAYEDKDLSVAIKNSILELGNLNSLLSVDSILFKVAKWKVSFGPKFRESIARLKDVEVTKEVVFVLEKLANGSHEHQKDKTEYLVGTSCQLLKCSVVKGPLRLVWTIDILRENKTDIQAIKVLDVLPRSQISELASEFDLLFGNYTMNQMSRCLEKRIEGGVMIPVTWPVVGNVRSAFSCNEVDANLASQLDAVSLRDKPESRSSRNFAVKNYRGGRRN